MRIKLKDIEFSSPLLTASGTYGYGHEVRDMVDVNQWGGLITKSVTRHPREGNSPPRIAETSSGMLNSIGLANLGVEKYIEEITSNSATSSPTSSSTSHTSAHRWIASTDTFVISSKKN